VSVYVYSVTTTSHPHRLDGLKGVGDPPAELRTVREGDLAAVVSDAPDALRPKRRDLGAHQAVQERLMADGAVLPLQFGLTAANDDAVRTALADRAGQYAERLAALDGHVEYNVKSAVDQEVLLREILLRSEEARRMNTLITSGDAPPDMPMALGELIAREVESRNAALAEVVVGRLRPRSEDTRRSDPVGEDFVNVSFLVPRKEEEQFSGAVDDLATELGEAFDVRCRGPLPVYSFV
jgi:hypothetical protein